MKYIIAAIALILAGSYGIYTVTSPGEELIAVGGDGTIRQLDQWKNDGTYITQNRANTYVKLTGYESSGDCLVTNSSGVVSTSSCGGGGSSKWTDGGSVIYPAGGESVSGSFFSGTSTTATSTFVNASSTRFCLGSDCRTSWPTGGGSGSNWTIVSGGLQTSTSTDFVRASNFIATSTTATSTFTNAGISNLSALTSAGLILRSNANTNIADFGAGGGSNATFYGGVNIDGATRLATSLNGFAYLTNGAVTGSSTISASAIDSAIARDSELHSAVTLSGALDYITLVGQDIVRGAIDLATDITGTLLVGNGGTGLTSTSTFLFENEIDTETELETFLTDVTNVFTNNDGALADDNLTNNSIEDLNDVAAMTENTGDLLSWNGSTWTDTATSSLGYSWNNLINIPAGFADNTDDTGGGSGGGLSTTSPWTNGNLAYVTGLGSVGSVATGTLTTTATGTQFSATRGVVGGSSVFSWATGYDAVLFASSTQWSNFYNTPSSRITAGTNLSWSGNTLNATGGGGSSATSTMIVCASGCTYSSIQDAINAGFTNIELKAETYAGPVSIIASDTKIKGAGLYSSLITCAATASTACVKIATSTNLTRITLEHFGIDNTLGTTLGIGLDTSNTSNVYVTNVRITEFNLGHFHQDTNNQSFYSSFNNMVYFDNNNCFATAGTKSNDNTISNARCRVATTTGIGYKLVDAEGWLLSSVNSEPGSVIGTGLYIDGTSISNTIINPWFEGNATATEILSGAINTSIKGGRMTAGTIGIADAGIRTFLDSTLVSANTTDFTAGSTGITMINGRSTFSAPSIVVGTTTPGTTYERLILGLSTSEATANALVINNYGAFATAPSAILFNNTTGGFAGTARIFANPGSGYTDANLNFAVADSAKALQTRMTIDVGGDVGIGTTTPGSKLVVVGGGQFTGLVSCDSIDTNASGILTCGTDATGGGGGGGALSTTTDVIGSPATAELVSYVTGDVMFGGSASTSAEFQLDDDAGQFIISSTSNSNATATIESNNVTQSVRIGDDSGVGMENIFSTVGDMITRFYGAIIEWIIDIQRVAITGKLFVATTTYNGATTTDALVIDGYTNSGEWIQEFCTTPVAETTQLVADTLRGCGRYAYSEDAAGALDFVVPTTGTSTYFNLQPGATGAANAAGDGMGINWASGLDFGDIQKSQPAMEFAIRQDTMANATGTFIQAGITSAITINPDFAAEPAQGFYVFSSSTLANYWLACNPSTGNTTYIDTGIASSTTATANANPFVHFRLEVGGTVNTAVTAILKGRTTTNRNMTQLASCTLDLSASTQAVSPVVGIGKSGAGTSSDLHLMFLKFWYKQPVF